MQQTSNYNLNKPEEADAIDIAVLDENFDIIDIEIKKISDKANLISTAGGTGTAITLTNVTLVNGFTVTFVVAGNNNSAATTINGKPLYKPGTTTSPKLLAGKAVTVWYNGTNFFIKASAEGDAVVGNVLAGKIFSNDDDIGLIGIMPNNGPVAAETINLTAEGAEYTIPAGYHSGLRKMKAVITGLIASVIKAGVTVGGILGTFTSDATATAGQMLSGAIAYVNGNKITGTIASKTSQTYTPGTANQTIAAGQYLSGIQTIAGDADLIGANIKAGANIFGVAGKASVVDTADATIPDGSWLLTGASAYKNGVKIDGTMPIGGNDEYSGWVRAKYDGQAPSDGRAHFYIPKDKYYNGTINNGQQGVFADDPEFLPGNILASANIFGMQGNIPVKSTGYTQMDGLDGSANGILYLHVPRGYYDGGGLSWVYINDPAFIPSNIVNTTAIFGKQGTAIAGKRFASGVTEGSASPDYFFNASGSSVMAYLLTVSGLTFKPSIIIAKCIDVVNNIEYSSVLDRNAIVDIGGFQSTSGTVKSFGINISTGQVQKTVIYKGSSTGIITTTTGFTIPVDRPSLNYTWVAYE
jgi:hypothetical protein